jgi:hypothetical protein
MGRLTNQPLNIGADWRAKAPPAPQKTYCGARKTLGHGEADICGKHGPGGLYQCIRCEAKDVLAAGRGLSDTAQRNLLAAFVQRIAGI